MLYYEEGTYYSNRSTSIRICIQIVVLHTYMYSNKLTYSRENITPLILLEYSNTVLSTKYQCVAFA